MIDDDLVLRRADFELDDEQEALQESFRAFFQRECPTERVRAAEPLGFDEQLWKELAALRAVAMGVPAEAGGDGAGLDALVLVAEELGRSLAPVPLIEGIVAARVLARAGDAGSQALAGVLDGSRVVTIALAPARRGTPRLLPAGAIADAVVALDGDELVAVGAQRVAANQSAAANIGSAPLAWWDVADTDEARAVLATGARAHEYFDDAVREWKLLVAGALLGVIGATLALSVEHAKNRQAFGVPIGTFQAVAHRIADVSIALDGAQKLTRKAAWFAEHEPEALEALVPMAFLYATRSAELACTVGVHVHGGLGFTLESDLQLYFRRAKSWSLLAGDPQRELLAIADALYGPAE